MFKELDPVMHSEVRLRIISLLVSMEEADFKYLLEQTKATAGNLSIQIEKLQSVGYIEVNKIFRNKRPCTLYRITQKGLEAFQKYVESLKSFLNNH